MSVILENGWRGKSRRWGHLFQEEFNRLHQRGILCLQRLDSLPKELHLLMLLPNGCYHHWSKAIVAQRQEGILAEVGVVEGAHKLREELLYFLGQKAQLRFMRRLAHLQSESPKWIQTTYP